MKKNFRGFGFYVILILIVIGVWYMLDSNQSAANTYSALQFEEDLEEGDTQTETYIDPVMTFRLKSTPCVYFEISCKFVIFETLRIRGVVMDRVGSTIVYFSMPQRVF